MIDFITYFFITIILFQLLSNSIGLVLIYSFNKSNLMYSFIKFLIPGFYLIESLNLITKRKSNIVINEEEISYEEIEEDYVFDIVSSKTEEVEPYKVFDNEINSLVSELDKEEINNMTPFINAEKKYNFNTEEELDLDKQIDIILGTENLK